MRKLALAAGLASAGLAGLPAAAAPVVIAALGDSLTQGYGLPAEAGLVPQLQDWLHAEGAEVTLINAGVSGDTSAGGLSRLDWTLTPEVEGLIVTLGGNDLLRGLAPSVTRDNLDRLVARATAQGIQLLLVGMKAPGNFGPDYKSAFDAIYPDLAERYGTLLAPDLLAPLTAIEDRSAALRRYMQADGIHPNAEGVALIVEALGPKVLQLVERIEGERKSGAAVVPSSPTVAEGATMR